MYPTLSQKSFLLTLSGLCFLYFCFQLFYTSYITLSVDEFWFAHQTYQYHSGVPYRDFAPYKTVLGYYLLLLPLSLLTGLLKPLFFIKNSLALLNAILFFAISCWLTKFFSRAGVLTACGLLISSVLVITYSTDIRVDFLAYWFCFISVLFLLGNRFIIAGIFLGLGFLISQKTLWYISASNIALIVYWLTAARTTQTLKNIFYFNFYIFLTIAIYILFWGWISNVHTVLHSVFYEAYIMYQLDWYSSARKLFWTFTLINNPLLFILWPLTLISLFIKTENDISYPQRIFSIVYAWVILFSLIQYKQVFPYYMLTTVPAFLLLYSSFFSWVYSLSTQIILTRKKTTWILLFSYEIYLIFLYMIFPLPHIYLICGLLPILLDIIITRTPAKFFQALHQHLLIFFMIIIFFTGVIFPLGSFAILLPTKNGAYQKSTLYLSNALLQDGSDYLAGIELFYNKNQPISGLKHLDGPAIDYLYSPRPKLRPAMLASLYHTPDITAAKAIFLIQHSRVKFYVNNYRINALPPLIKNYLASQYEHFWGSIYLYAPIIAFGTQWIDIKFPGAYRLESEIPVKLDGKIIQPNGMMILNASQHFSEAKKTYRLKLIPENVSPFLSSEFKNDQWKNVLG